MATRSPNYPAVGLGEAVEMAQQLWNQEERAPVTPETAVGAFGYESLSGPARTRLAALKKYGLLEDTAQGVRLSNLAVRILHGADSEDRNRALREAALMPELFRELAQNHLSASERGLTSYLLTQKEFSSTGAKRCARSFLDTVAFANLDDSAYTVDETSQEPESTKEQPTVATVAQKQEATPLKVIRFSWPLSREVSVEVTFSGSDVRASHIDTLEAYLRTVKKAVGDSDNGDTEGSGTDE